MRAYVHEGKPGLENTFFSELVEAEPKKGEVKVQIKTAGLNHRDIWNLYRRKENSEAVVLGSDGAGVICATGDGVKNVQIGDEVIINPSLRWHEKSDAPPVDFEILGVPANGTFAEFVIVQAENVEPKPKYLSWEEAGVLPLAALTAYRALVTRAKIKPFETVFIPGIGSGVATFGLLMAKAIGARVIVSSRSKDKCDRALELGADFAFDSNVDWKDYLSGEKFDVVIDSIGPATFDKSLEVLKPGGRMIVYGATSGKEVTINLQNLYFGQFNILGTTMGSQEEFREMLQFIEKHQIKPVIDQVYRFEDTMQAFHRMNEGKQLGKIGLKID